jgi:probable rRNA maturation factor
VTALAGEGGVTVCGEARGLGRAACAVAVRVLRGERRRARVAITFVGKRQMQRLNAEHLGHDYATDVITFSLPQPGGLLLADIYVCRYVAARNARAHATSVRKELLRLVVHGALHGLGWDHPAGASRTRSPMWRRQERYLAGFA